MSSARRIALYGIIVLHAVTPPWSAAVAQVVIQTVFYEMPEHLLAGEVPAPSAQLLAVPGYAHEPGALNLVARLYLPDPSIHGDGPHPAVVLLHGSGGMWPNSNTIPGSITATNSPTLQFRDWGNLLVAMGYVCLVPDSFHPRGITGSFEGRRPHHDPGEDDAICSPNYERPKDVTAALEYLTSRGDIDMQRTALIGFSHGAQTGMNALVDASVDLGTYQVNWINPNNLTESKDVPSPVRLPAHIPVPKFCAFYYGGGGHFDYHGSPNSTAAGRYMLDRRTTAILFHGSDDYLLDADIDEGFPVTGNLYPIKQVLSSAAQAATLGLPNPIVRHYLMDRTDVHVPPTARVAHSFDLGSVGFAPPQDQDGPLESPDQKARRMARDEVLRWLEFKLKPQPTLGISQSGAEPVELMLAWDTRPRIVHELLSSGNLTDWSPVTNPVEGDGLPGNFQMDAPESGPLFFRLRNRVVPMPVDAPEHDGFFLSYDDFDL